MEGIQLVLKIDWFWKNYWSPAVVTKLLCSMLSSAAPASCIDLPNRGYLMKASAALEAHHFLLKTLKMSFVTIIMYVFIIKKPELFCKEAERCTFKQTLPIQKEIVHLLGTIFNCGLMVIEFGIPPGRWATIRRRKYAVLPKGVSFISTNNLPNMNTVSISISWYKITNKLFTYQSRRNPAKVSLLACYLNSLCLQQNT